MPQKLLTDLPADVVQHILVRMTLAHHIARTAPTCKVVSVAVRNVIKALQFSGEIVTLASGGVAGVAAAHDGRILTAWVETVKVWRDGGCERTIRAHTNWMCWAVAVLPGGERFVSVSNDGYAKVWTLDGSHERAINVGSVVYCVAALPDGVHFVVGVDKEVRLYDVDGTLVHAFKGHTRDVRTVAATRDGQYIISGAEDTLVKAWSVASKKLVSTCRGHTRRIMAVAAMPDGQRILSGGLNTTVRVWLLNGTHQNTFYLHTESVTALVALPDNQHALSGSWDSTVKLFNVNDGAVVRTFKHHNNRVRSLSSATFARPARRTWTCEPG